MGFEIGFAGAVFDPASTITGDEPEDDVTTWIVQFREPLSAEEIENFRSRYKLRLVDFVPQLAYIERVPHATVVTLRLEPKVRVVVPYTFDFKLDPAIGARTRFELKSASPPWPIELDAVLFDDADTAAAASAIAKQSGHDVTVLDSRHLDLTATIRFKLDDLQFIEAIALIDAVRWIEPVPEIVDDGPLGPAPAIGREPFVAAWENGLHGEGQIIGIIDNGPPHRRHCFFADPQVPDPAPTHRKILEIRNKSNTRQQPHATFVAGCAAGDDFNRTGDAPARGGAWAARLVCGNNRDLSGSQLALELGAAAASGAKIHTNSWHTRPFGGQASPSAYDTRCADVDSFTWLNEEHLVLGASGNTGEEQGPPGTAKNAICVSAAAVDGSLGDGNPGPTPDGRRKPDIMMVGCGIESAKYATPCDTETEVCASSYATPLAAAAAALIRQYFMEGRYPAGEPDPDRALTPSAALVKAVLVNATTHVATTPGNASGWGIPDLRRSLHFPGGRRRLWIHDARNRVGLLPGASSRIELAVRSDDEPLKVTLAWTEPPGTIGSVDPVINNLDLVATSPSGTRLLGNVFAGGVSRPGGQPDARNNVEVVLVDRPSPGRWVIVVHAVAVSVGNPGQGFALAVSGDLAA